MSKNKSKKEKRKAPPQQPKPKYGVPELAEELGIGAFAVRVKLRTLEVAKNGRYYGWESQKKFKSVLADLRAMKAEKKGKKKKKKSSEDDDE